MKPVEPKKLVYVDESGANTKVGRSHAWTLRPGPRENRSPIPMNWELGKEPHHDWRGAVQRSRFVAHEICLDERDSICSMDSNLGSQTSSRRHRREGQCQNPHHDRRVRQVLKGYHVGLVYHSPYSPQILTPSNRLELAWANTKREIRSFAPRLHESLRKVAARVFWRITSKLCSRWFQSSVQLIRGISA